VRVSLTLMLVVSLALHVILAAGVAFSFYHRAANPGVVSSATAPPPVMLLRGLALPKAPPVAPTKFVPNHSVASAQPFALPSPALPMVERSFLPASPPIAQHVEANPNAHVRALPPETVLSPNPAPHLNGTRGVVFILDVSGSMYEPYAGSTRLACARQMLSDLILALKDGTPFAVTLYAESACSSGPLVSANNATRAAATRFIMRDVDCGGGTNLPAGLALARQLHTGSLVLVSDGDLNISELDLMTRAHDILGLSGLWPSLTVIGISPRPGTGADHLLQDLADQQGGSYQFADVGDVPALLTSASGAIKPPTATP